MAHIGPVFLPTNKHTHSQKKEKIERERKSLTSVHRTESEQMKLTDAKFFKDLLNGLHFLLPNGCWQLHLQQYVMPFQVQSLSTFLQSSFCSLSLSLSAEWSSCSYSWSSVLKTETLHSKFQNSPTDLVTTVFPTLNLNMSVYAYTHDADTDRQDKGESRYFLFFLYRCCFQTSEPSVVSWTGLWAMIKL